MNYDAFFKEFCKEQSEELFSAGTRKRKSILLQMQDDIDYNLGLYRIFKVFGLTPEQHRHLDTQLAPLLVVPLLYCSAVDLMARVKHKGSPSGQNGEIFKESARIFFDLSKRNSEILWNFRNSLSHQYSIRKYVISRSGSSNVIEDHNGRIVIFVRAMRGSLNLAIDRLYEFLINEDDRKKGLSSNFIDKHGFTYYLIV